MRAQGFEHFVRNRLRAIPIKVKLNFFRQIGMLTGAGIPILKTLKMLHKSAKSNMKALLKNAIDLIEQGNDFSKIGLYYPSFFDKTTIAMIKAGEQSGNLPEVFKQIFINLEKKDKFKSKIKGALKMPLFTLIFAIGVVFFMAIKVIPEFAKFLGSMGADLPPLTKMVLDISNYLIETWQDILIYSGAGLATIIVLYITIKPIRYALDYILIYIPLIGGISLFGNLASFSNTMAKLIGSGVGLTDSLKISKEGVTLLPLAKVINDAIDTIVAGGEFSQSFIAKKFIPDIYSDLLQAGEEGGNLDETLTQLTLIYEEETDIRIASLQSSIQPIMTIFIGLLVGTIAASLILGMVSLYSQ